MKNAWRWLYCLLLRLVHQVMYLSRLQVVNAVPAAMISTWCTHQKGMLVHTLRTTNSFRSRENILIFIISVTLQDRTHHYRKRKDLPGKPCDLLVINPQAFEDRKAKDPKPTNRNKHHLPTWQWKMVDSLRKSSLLTSWFRNGKKWRNDSATGEVLVKRENSKTVL